MRAILVNVPTPGSHLRSVPLGILYIISSGRHAGYDISFLDGSLCGTMREFHLRLLSREFDCVGLSAMTHNFPLAAETAALLRKERPDAKIIIGGAHASTVPEEAAHACPGAYVMAGEGEDAFLALLAAFEGRGRLEDVPGLYLARESGELFRGAAPKAIADLDSLPLPAYDLVDFSRYARGAHGLYYRRKPIAPVVTSRGCPFHCSFCAKSALTGDTWRARSAENVLDELEILHRKYGVREIHFEDDNMALDRNRLVAICRGILDRGIDITWKCPHGIYAAHLEPEEFALMRRSGCYSLSFGVESGSDEILARAGKAADTARIRRGIESAHAAGIECVGFFIFGLEGETPETIRRTIDFAKSLPLDAAQFNLCIPFKGTPIRDRYLAQGYIAEAGLAAYDVDHAVVNLPGLPAADLKRWRLRAFMEFYGRPRVFLKNVRHLSSPDMLAALFSRLRNIWRA